MGDKTKGNEQLQKELPGLVDALTKGSDDILPVLTQMEKLCGRENRQNRLPMGIGGYGTLAALRYAMEGPIEAKLSCCQILRNLAVEEEVAIAICNETAFLKSLHSAAIDSSSNSTQEASLKDKALTVFFHLSDVEENRKALLLLENQSAPAGIVNTCCRPLLQEDNYKAQRALMFIAILVGREESGAGELLTSNPALIDKIVALLRNVLTDEQYTKKWGWKITHPLYPLRNLCIADKNKEQLATKDNVMLLAQVLETHSANKSACRLAVGTLLELSFRYEDERELTAHLFDQEVRDCLLPLLEKDTSPEADHVKHRIKSTEKDDEEDDAEDTNEDTREGRHIMMSYSWSAKKEHVIELSNLLRAKGYDVWRDEDGSSHVPPMGAGGVDEIMASAVEKAALVIVFVSKAYKESANCRMEGQYANRERKHGNVEVAFVMMDENYTTVSRGTRVDGWLGIMIGDALWYPAWDRSQLQETADRLAVKVEKLPHSVQSPSSQKQTTPSDSAAAPKGSSKSEKLVKAVKQTVQRTKTLPPESTSAQSSLSTSSAPSASFVAPSAQSSLSTTSAPLVSLASSGNNSPVSREPARLNSGADSVYKEVCRTSLPSGPFLVETVPEEESEPSLIPNGIYSSRSNQEAELNGVADLVVELSEFGVDLVQCWLVEKRLRCFCEPFKQHGLDARGLFTLKLLAMSHDGFSAVQLIAESCQVEVGEALSLYWELTAVNAVAFFNELEAAGLKVKEQGFKLDSNESDSRSQSVPGNASVSKRGNSLTKKATHNTGAGKTELPTVLEQQLSGYKASLDQQQREVTKALSHMRRCMKLGGKPRRRRGASKGRHLPHRFADTGGSAERYSASSTCISPHAFVDSLGSSSGIYGHAEQPDSGKGVLSNVNNLFITKALAQSEQSHQERVQDINSKLTCLNQAVSVLHDVLVKRPNQSPTDAIKKLSNDTPGVVVVEKRSEQDVSSSRLFVDVPGTSDLNSHVTSQFHDPKAQTLQSEAIRLDKSLGAALSHLDAPGNLGLNSHASSHLHDPYASAHQSEAFALDRQLGAAVNHLDGLGTSGSNSYASSHLHEPKTHALDRSLGAAVNHNNGPGTPDRSRGAAVHYLDGSGTPGLSSSGTPDRSRGAALHHLDGSGTPGLSSSGRMLGGSWNTWDNRARVNSSMPSSVSYGDTQPSERSGLSFSQKWSAAGSTSKSPSSNFRLQLGFLRGGSA